MTRFGPKDHALIAATGLICGVLSALLWRGFSTFYGSLCVSAILFYFFRITVLRVLLVGWCAGQAWVWFYSQWMVELNVSPQCLNTPFTVQANVRNFVDEYPGFNDTVVQRAELDITSVSLPDCAALERIRVYYTGPRTLRLGDQIVGPET